MGTTFSGVRALADLKPGDRVHLKNKCAPCYSILTIDRVTETQIVCGPRRYSRADGGSIPRGSSGIEPATAEHIAAWEADRQRLEKQDAERTAYSAREDVQLADAILSLSTDTLATLGIEKLRMIRGWLDDTKGATP